MEVKKIHIGGLIKSVCETKDINQSQLGRLIGTSRQNIRDIMNRDTIDVKLLFTISEVLNYDFFAPFRISKETESQKTKLTLNIEIGEDKGKEIFKYIQDKQLYDILKNNDMGR